MQRTLSEGHAPMLDGTEIIRRVEPHLQVLPETVCEWCTSVIRPSIQKLDIRRKRHVIFLCPVCREYSKTKCISLKKCKWFIRKYHKHLLDD